MHRLRHRGRASRLNRIWWAIALVVLLVSFATGCREEPGETAQEYRESLESTGSRVLVVDDEDTPKLKIRVRHNKYKVYDGSMSAVGFVTWKVDDDGESPTRIETRDVDGDTRRIERIDDDEYGLDDDLRIERTGGGWAVFGPDAELLGIFEREDDRWQLRRSYQQGPVWRTEEDGARITTGDDDKTALRLETGQIPAPVLLAWQLEGLEPLERIAVGVWIDADGDSDQ